MKYCCNELKDDMVDKYPSIVLYDDKFYIKDNGARIIYCPFCGKELHNE